MQAGNKSMKKRTLDTKGFTLLEILVAMAVFGVVVGAVYSAYYTQQRSYEAQTEVSFMNQNLRAAILLMERELRMAGCDPTQGANAGFTTASSNTVAFTMDIRGDSAGSDPDGDTLDSGEAITYALGDPDGDGDTDLTRNNVMIAENIDALDFVYLDEDGNVITNPASNISSIRSIQISLVARTGKADRAYVNTDSYSNQQGTTILAAQNDNFRRRLLTAEIRCRNMGLK